MDKEKKDKALTIQQVCLDCSVWHRRCQFRLDIALLEGVEDR